jgi:hypothetical protein
MAFPLPSPPPPNPATPAPYVAGRLQITPMIVHDLLNLIQGQIDPDCPGTSVDLTLVADTNNGQPIFVGANSKYAGPLNTNNWAYVLNPGDMRIYQATYPGNTTPLGRLQLYCVSPTVLHIEVVT